MFLFATSGNPGCQGVAGVRPQPPCSSSVHPPEAAPGLHLRIVLPEGVLHGPTLQPGPRGATHAQPKQGVTESPEGKHLWKTQHEGAQGKTPPWPPRKHGDTKHKHLKAWLCFDKSLSWMASHAPPKGTPKPR